MIFDFDVHHGDGTQAIFYEDASVLTVDMHQKGVWPGTGDSLEIGRGKAEGSVVNIPLPGARSEGWHCLQTHGTLSRCWAL